jgi:hypothetical protein
MLLCILMFGSNIVGPACSKEGRAEEAGRRVVEVDATYAGGPTKANGMDTRGQQPLVGLCASVHAEPWSHGGATSATPSTTAGLFPPLPRPANLCPVSYFPT